jgi:hypothetical protein
MKHKIRCTHRSRHKDKHHNVNRSEGGSDSQRNLFMLDTERHYAWHLLFGHMTFQEVAEMLLRAVRMKEGYYNRIHMLSEKGGEYG